MCFHIRYFKCPYQLLSYYLRFSKKFVTILTDCKNSFTCCHFCHKKPVKYFIMMV
nr:MAG TPA: hypothetical protein [Caudoviricetes sp.]